MKSSNHKTDCCLVISRGRNMVYKVWYYDNNLTKVQCCTFTSWRRAASFIDSLTYEKSIPLVYLETIETA